MGHVKYMDESRHIYRWVMSHMWFICESIYRLISHVTYIVESCETCMDESCHTWITCVTWLIRRNLGKYMKGAHIYMTHLYESHVRHDSFVGVLAFMYEGVSHIHTCTYIYGGVLAHIEMSVHSFKRPACCPSEYGSHSPKSMCCSVVQRVAVCCSVW